MNELGDVAMKKDVLVLGINDGHDASAAIIKNGSVLAAIAEERLRKIKHFGGVPSESLQAVFKVAKVQPEEIDIVAISGLNIVLPALKSTSGFGHMFASALHSTFIKYTPLIESSDSLVRLAVKVLHRFRPTEGLFKILNELGLSEKKVTFIEHHLAHAASTYRTCPWTEDTLILTSDFVGDWISSTVNVGRNNVITRIAQSTLVNSVGAFYTSMTKYLGLKPWNDEYKVMGLAPYGKSEYPYSIMKKMIGLSPKYPLVFQNNLHGHYTRKFGTISRMLRFQRFDNIAAAVQKRLEDLLSTWVRNSIEKTDIHKVALAGGIFLNVKANMKIRKMPEVEDVFTFPAAGDAGTAVGAALEAYSQFCKAEGLKSRKVFLKDVYFGPQYSTERIEHVLKAEGLSEKAQYCQNIAQVVGEHVANGKIIAWFDGRMEFGPRALGNRSILADASDWRMVSRINEKIKHRTWWMPFAPAILKKRVPDYLVEPEDSPYMTMAFETTNARNEIIAAVHPKDFTVRPQTLDVAWNPRYHEILSTFEEIRGIGGILNTSFNLHGYPIVCTPQQAIWTYKNSALDGLAMGNYLLLR